jgi:hypothetical protein
MKKLLIALFAIISLTVTADTTNTCYATGRFTIEDGWYRNLHYRSYVDFTYNDTTNCFKVSVNATNPMLSVTNNKDWIVYNYFIGSGTGEGLVYINQGVLSCSVRVYSSKRLTNGYPLTMVGVNTNY